MATSLPAAATDRILSFLDAGRAPSSSSTPPPPPPAPGPPPFPSAGAAAAAAPSPPSTDVRGDTEPAGGGGAASTAGEGITESSSDGKPRLLTLPPTTAHLLLSDSDALYSPSFDVVDHAFGRDFRAALGAEVADRGWLDGLRPAITAMEAGAMGPLLRHNEGRGSDTDTRQGEQALPRGDLSTFVPRSARRDPKFRLRNPRLHELVSGIQSEAVRCLSGGAWGGDEKGGSRLRFDEAMTSIQISQYPGNGSFYVRHCDRGPTCAAAGDPVSSSAWVADNDRGPAQRLVTAVYYLNEEDWCSERDGGSLRVYSPKRRRHRGIHDANGDEEQHHDMAPLSDRLVLFRSDLVEHEVLPCHRRRLAVTVWLYGWVTTRTGRGEEVPPPSVDDAAGREIEEESSPERGTGENGAMDESPVERPTVPLDTADGASKHRPERGGPSSPPPLPILESSDGGKASGGTKESIFVAIPSYRDSETYPTIRDLVDKATSPDRIFVGVVLQIDTAPSAATAEHSSSDVHSRSHGETDEESLRRLLPPDWARTNLRVVTVDYRHSTGPCWARSVAQGLWRGEGFVLQIDSHMRFRRNWDSYLMGRLMMCPDPRRSILTTYPQGYALPGEVPDDVRPTVLVPYRFDDNGMLRQRGRLLKDAGGSGNNIPSPLWAAGFNFATSDALLECPYDPLLHHLFFGEEPSMAVRLFTGGFDFFAPPQAVCYHLWSRDHRSTFRTDMDGADGAGRRRDMREKSVAIVSGQLLGKGRGLGDVRTVGEFADRVGVDFATKMLSPDAENANIDPSRFVESATPSDLSSLVESVVGSISSVR